jgi:hypothetical protein
METIPLVPAKSMQFGHPLWFIISTVHHADPRLVPIFQSKVNIADGFYRIWVNVNEVPNLGVVVPTEKGHPQVIGFPLVLPMGWIHPPLFTASTETMANLANQELRASMPTATHRLDAVSTSVGPAPEISRVAIRLPTAVPAVPLPTNTKSQGRSQPKLWDAYAEFFIRMVKGVGGTGAMSILFCYTRWTRLFCHEIIRTTSTTRNPTCSRGCGKAMQHGPIGRLSLDGSLIPSD